MPQIDAHSRSPIDIMCVSIDNILSKIKLAQESDNKVKAIKKLLSMSDYENYCDRNGILYKFNDGRELLLVPNSTQTENIRIAHEKDTPESKTQKNT